MAARDDGLIGVAEVNALLDQIAEIARAISVQVIETAISTPGSNQGDIDEAQDFLADGDEKIVDNDYEDGIDNYKDAVSKAEGALP